jgi:hypothetical protein
MLRAKIEFENTRISYRLGTVNIEINVNDITEAHINAAKRYGVDLSQYVEKDELEIPNNLIKLQDVSGSDDNVPDNREVHLPKEGGKGKNRRSKRSK